jgi:agmatine deiminase
MKTQDFIRYGIFAGSLAKIIFLLLSVAVVAQDAGREEAEIQPKNSGGKEDFSFPPEWEPHEAVWIDWPEMQPYPEIYQTKIKMINALHRNVNVKLLTHADSLKELAVKMMLDENIDTSRVEILFHEIPNYFIRDAGPKYLTNGKDYIIADFEWNCYGLEDMEDRCYERGKLDNDIAAQSGIPVRETDIVIEGGAIEVNSSVILSIKEMAEHRNPGYSLAEIEKQLLTMYGKEKVIWVDKIPLLEQHGHKIDNYFGQGATGHIDNFMRFVNDSTILVGVIDSSEKNSNPVNQVDYYRLKHNLNQIKQATDIIGNSFYIIELPMPDITHYAWRGKLTSDMKNSPWNKRYYENFEVGDSIVYIPIMSYLNFFISNGVVLIHKYWEEGIPESEKKKDEYVYETFKKLFPDRKVVQINALPLNWNGGGIHCATQQVPKFKSVNE